MLAIRLFRVGKRNRPAFRIVVTDKKNPPSAGRFLEILGFYNPLTKERKVNAERAKYWISVGAKPSETAHNLLVSEKIIEEKKIPSHKKKKGEPATVKASVGKEEKPTAEVPKAEEVVKKEPEKEAVTEKPKEATKPEITEAKKEETLPGPATEEKEAATE